MNRSSQISRRSQGLRASRRWNTGRTRAPGFLACAGLPPTTPFRTRDPALEQRTRRQVSRSQVLYPDYTLRLRNGPFPPRFLAPLRHPLQHPSIDAKFWNYLVLGSKNGLGRIGCTRGVGGSSPSSPICAAFIAVGGHLCVRHPHWAQRTRQAQGSARNRCFVIALRAPKWLAGLPCPSSRILHPQLTPGVP